MCDGACEVFLCSKVGLKARELHARVRACLWNFDREGLGFARLDTDNVMLQNASYSMTW